MTKPSLLICRLDKMPPQVVLSYQKDLRRMPHSHFSTGPDLANDPRFKGLVSDDDPLRMFAWRLGRGFQHMRMTEAPGIESPEFGALEEFWQTTASIDLNLDNARKLLELAKAIPDFPPAALSAAEVELSRVKSPQ